MICLDYGTHRDKFMLAYFLEYNDTFEIAHDKNKERIQANIVLK